MESEIGKGMMVRVKNDLSRTYSRYGRGSGGAMERMRNKIFPVAHAGPDRVKIYSKDSDYHYTFHLDDIIVVDDGKITYPDPVMFNPNQLYME